MKSDAEVLFVDDEEHLRLAAEQSLSLAGLSVLSFAEAATALEHISRDCPGVLVSDIRMRGMDGMSLMRRALEIDPELPVVLITGHGDVALAVQAMQEGAYDFLEKPFAPARLVGAVERARDKRTLTLENRALRRAIGHVDPVEQGLTGRSAAMIALRAQLGAIADTDADVLITGATGTGKAVAARALHDASARAKGPFVLINCAALPEHLVESELFGHEAGAFPGAVRPRFGKFEHGRGGTVLLDEIDSLSLPLQAKLLHAVQDRRVTRLGSNDPTDLDLRFIAASKADLEKASAEGTFRSDLYYRLNGVTLRMPELSARREDIPELFMQLVAEAALRNQRTLPEVPGAVLSALAAKDWPGNVRQLKNVAERFALGLDLEIGPARNPSTTGTLTEKLAAHEKSLIAAAITTHGGSLKATYEDLGISRKALYDKMQKYGLSRRDFTSEG
ncbi:MAG: sigma-54 dependent transcriptional regulator [Pseudomonadota bacterium]